MTKIIQQIENNLKPDYFKSLPNNEHENEELDNKLFDIVLVDILKSDSIDVKCIKKNMYDSELKYIAVSYRWGELNEQQVETPDYTAHITSFHLKDLMELCDHIINDPDLKNIPYVWIDAISVDQQNQSRKKETILKMNQIYQNATYILAVPDLHKEYLMKHPLNKEILHLIWKYRETVSAEIYNNEELDNDHICDYDDNENPISIKSIPGQHTNNNTHYSFKQKLKNMNMINEDVIKKIEELFEIELKIKCKELKMKNKNKKVKKEKEKIYQFLAYLIEDWSNRAWVISEYQIAKDKYIKHGTPLKYMFTSLWEYRKDAPPFFSYHFNDDDGQLSTINDRELACEKVNDPISFNQFVKSRFMKRSHLEMILNSNASRNEDRFNAILLSWNKYNYLIKNKNTISGWNITDMTSVILKLYEIMDDLWDKAALFHACRFGKVLPTFASAYDMDYLNIFEKMNYSSVAYKKFEKTFLQSINEKKAIKIKQLMDEYKMDSKLVWNENLTSIQFEPLHCYLSVKSKSYFIMDLSILGFASDKHQNKLSLGHEDKIHQVFIPFFTFNLPGYVDYFLIYENGSYMQLIGNKNKNKWILENYYLTIHESKHFCSDDYIFNIY